MSDVHVTSRGAWFSLSTGPTGRAMIAAGGALVIGLLLGLQEYEKYSQLLLLAATGVGLGFGQSAVGEDRSSGRAALYFQRPVSPVAHHVARIALGAALCAAILLVSGIITSVFYVNPFAWAESLWAFYWLFLLMIVSTAISTLVVRFDMVVAFGLLVASMAFYIFPPDLGVPAAHLAIRWLLLPIGPVFNTWSQWRAGLYVMDPEVAAHLLFQPLLWAGILLRRLRREDLQAASYHVA